MPRQARIDIPGLLQHVIVRGIERRNIFRSNTDRRDFIERFSKLLVETDTDCFAWALIPNHFHLLLRPNSNSLQQFMRRLLTGYAIGFNRRHKRSGYLFQNRYKSIVCEEESYLFELVRYIHLNPLRAGLVKDLDALERFAWCGHGGVLGKSPLSGQSIDEVLGLFAATQRRARTAYQRFIADGVEQEFQAFDERVLGSGAFVEQLRQRDEVSDQMMAGVSLTELLARLAAHFEMEIDEVRRRSRDARRTMVRDLFCALAVRRFHYSGVEVGREIGIRRAAVSHAVRRGELCLNKELHLAERLFSLNG